MNRCFVALPVLVAGALMSGQGHSATATRLFYQNGGNACTGALPTYEGALRKRPKAIANEGAGVAFVTCSASGDYLRADTPTSAFVWVTNRNANAVSLSCTFVNGDEMYDSTATPQTKSINPGIVVQMMWLPEAPAQKFLRHTVSVSCALPPGVEINTFGHRVREGVGA